MHGYGSSLWLKSYIIIIIIILFKGYGTTVCFGGGFSSKSIDITVMKRLLNLELSLRLLVVFNLTGESIIRLAILYTRVLFQNSANNPSTRSSNTIVLLCYYILPT